MSISHPLTQGADWGQGADSEGGKRLIDISPYYSSSPIRLWHSNMLVYIRPTDRVYYDNIAGGDEAYVPPPALLDNKGAFKQRLCSLFCRVCAAAAARKLLSRVPFSRSSLARSLALGRFD